MAQRLPAESNVKVNRIVVVIGTTGTGKSTLINMLYNDDTTQSACNEPCEVDITTRSVTKLPQWHLDPKTGRIFADTIGFSDSEESDEDIIAGLQRFLGAISEGVHSIILVARHGRLTRQDRLNIMTIRKIFGANWNRHTALVLTHCDDDLDTEENVNSTIEKWIKGDDAIEQFLKEIDKRIFLTNNKTSGKLEKLYLPVRQKLLKDLNNFINGCDVLVNPTPGFLIYMQAFIMISLNPRNISLVAIAFMTINNAAVEDMVKEAAGGYTNLGKDAVEIAQRQRAQTITKILEQSRMTVADCPICFNVISFQDMALTECNHTFHKNCLGEWDSKKMIRRLRTFCPICRQPIEKSRNHYLSI